MICTKVDDFILDKDKTYWIATLSDGTEVYEDDGRPGLERVSWFRLRDYCNLNKLSITKIALRFRSSYVVCCEPKYGVFFMRSVLGSMGLKGSDGREKSLDYYLIGEITDDAKIRVVKWRVPELLIEDDGVEIRNIEGNEDFIIWNYNHKLPVDQLPKHTT